MDQRSAYDGGSHCALRGSTTAFALRDMYTAHGYANLATSQQEEDGAEAFVKFTGVVTLSRIYSDESNDLVEAARCVAIAHEPFAIRDATGERKY